MFVLLMLHSIIRWAIVVVVLIAIIKFAWGWLGRQAFGKMDRGLMAGFAGLMDLQATLGILYLLIDAVKNGIPFYRVEHSITMIIAVVVAHLSARWKNAADDIRFRNYLFIILAALILIYAGVAGLPGGWTR